MKFPFKICLFLAFGLLIINQLNAQSDNLILGSKYYTLFDRLDIKLKHDSIFSFLTVKPFNRRILTERLQYIDSLNKTTPGSSYLTSVDRYNIQHFLTDNSEWTNNYDNNINISKKRTFYNTPAHLFEVNTKQFTFRVDPLLNLQIGSANDGTGSIYQNTRGVLLRGNIDKRIGFYSYVTDNQEKDPLYVRNYVAAHNGLPGAGFYKPYKNNGYDYFDMKGGISFRLAKYINTEFAYDKLFIGNGIRSLLLSDFSNNYLFLRLNTRLWKFKYEMIIAETFQSVPQIQREKKPRNYMAIHHLSAQVARWLNVGIYENIMENGSGGLQLGYLNPVIFYRAIESNLGAAGKANIGIDLKSNVTNKFQLYSQLLINEFHIHEILHYGQGAFVNKQALQLGGKYIDAFGISNLDLQGEINFIRPYTYTNFDSVTNFTHYNQPLAHPLGANVRELIGVIKYQPIPKLYLGAKLDYFYQGLDSAGINMGSDIFKSYISRPRDYGFFIGTGIPVTSLTAAFNASYEVYENMFLDFNITHRSYNIQNQSNSSVLIYGLGLRVNMAKRTFDF